MLDTKKRDGQGGGVKANQPSAGAVKLAKEIIVGDNRPLQFAQTIDRHVAPLVEALEKALPCLGAHKWNCDIARTSRARSGRAITQCSCGMTELTKSVAAALQQWEGVER